MRNDQPPALKFPMRSRAGAHVDLATLPAGVCLLDTEAKMLKAIEDLLPVASCFRGFKDNTRWSISSPVADVFHALYLKMLKPFTNGYIKIAMIEGVYRMMVRRPVFFDVNCPVMPVYFIAALEKMDKRLFELCFYLVALMRRQAGIELWEEDNEGYIYENIEANLADHKLHDSDNKKAIAELEKLHHEYGAKGEATLFSKRLSKSSASKKLWLKAFDAYKPDTQLKKDIYRWTRLGKELVEAGESMHKYIFLPPDVEENAEQYEQIPSTPDQTVKFLWSNSDCWFHEFDAMAEAEHSNNGSVPFYINKTITGFSDVTEIADSFPAKLLRFMKAGRELEKKYRIVFASPEKLKKALAPKPKLLIDIL